MELASRREFFVIMRFILQRISFALEGPPAGLLNGLQEAFSSFEERRNSMSDPTATLWAEITYELTVRQSGSITIPLNNIPLDSLSPEELLQVIISQASCNPQLFEAMAENNIIQLDDLPRVEIKVHRLYPDSGSGTPDLSHPIEISRIDDC